MLIYKFYRLLGKIVPKKYILIMVQVYLNLRSLIYVGNQVVCPCCEGCFRKFLPYEGKPNAVCPRCATGDRHRLLWLYLKNKTSLFFDNLKVLHFAPEYILQKNLNSLPNLDYISADLTSPLAMIKIDITNILYEDNSFDVILCSHVLEHVIDDQLAMRELFRVLKPGGWAILQVPIDFEHDRTFEDSEIVSPAERQRIFGHPDHVRIYGRDYKDRLEQAGFIVQIDNYFREFDTTIVKRYGLSEEDIYFCIKPK